MRLEESHWMEILCLLEQNLELFSNTQDGQNQTTIVSDKNLSGISGMAMRRSELIVLYRRNKLFRVTMDGKVDAIDVILRRPAGVAVDAMGDIFFSEYYEKTITRISFQPWNPKHHKEFPPSVKGTIREL